MGGGDLLKKGMKGASVEVLNVITVLNVRKS